jgi:hypothetical protein
MNTKVLFKTVRHMPRAQQPKPVMVRVASAPHMLLCDAPGNWAIVHSDAVWAVEQCDCLPHALSD